MKRKALLWITTALALAAPAVTLGIRARDGRTADALVVRGLAALDAPLERAARPESIDWRTAVDSFERARTLDPGGASGQRASAMFHVARAYEFLSRAEVVMAHTEATTAARMLGDDPRVKLCLALTTLRRGDPARAERLLDAVDRSDAPVAVRTRSGVHHVDVLLDAGRTHDALTLAESLDRLAPRSAAVANRLGLVRAAVSDVEGARAAFARARSIDPRDASPVINLARMERSRGALAEARTLLEQALAIDEAQGDAWLAYGVVLSELGPAHGAAARAAILRASRSLPDDAEPWAAQGAIDLQEAKWADAIESFREAIRRAPNHAGARANLGVALAQSGDRRGALHAFQEATELAPGTGAGWNGLGAMRLALGDAENAVGPLQQAMTLLPDDPNPSLNLGLALVRLQRWNDAAAAFRETLRRSPGNEVAITHLMTLQPDPAARARVAAMRRIAMR